jgi:hypothetical protein
MTFGSKGGDTLAAGGGGGGRGPNTDDGTDNLVCNIQHTKEGDIGREKTILMMSLQIERTAAVSRRQLLITLLPPTY